MARIGAESDPKLTQEFLLNLPNKFPVIEFEITFMALTPDQQAEALANFKSLFEYRGTQDRPKPKLKPEAIDLAIESEGKLFTVVSIALPSILDRIKFWTDFLNEENNYQELD